MLPHHPLVDKDDLAGEAKLFCRAREIDDVDEWERVRTAFLDERGFDMGEPGGSHLFTYDIHGAASSASTATTGAPAAGPQMAARGSESATEPSASHRRCSMRPSSGPGLRRMGVTLRLLRLAAAQRSRVAWWSLNLSTPARKPSAKIV